jgi:alkylation response protein AidB-like acyl-CoA dehydrogenase
MTFELSSEQHELQTRARTLAVERIAPLADSIDRDGVIAPDLRGELERAELVSTHTSATDAIVAVEEWATASAAVAAAAGLASTGELARFVWVDQPGSDSPGLRGLGDIDEAFKTLPADAAARSRVVLAAVAVGIGRAALEEALAFMRAAGDRPSGDPDERPHWILADAAAELDGARLLTQKAAQAVDRGQGRADASLAKVFAADLAERAVDAAVRILGPAGYRRGSRLERLTRDARAIALVGGTGEEHRALVADLTLPT